MLYTAVADGERVRIATTGKPLVVELLADASCGEIDWKSLELLLFDKNTETSYRASSKGDQQASWILHDSKRMLPELKPSQQFVPVKVFLARTKICFNVSVRTSSGVLLKAQSISWYPTNSGASRAERKRKQQEAEAMEAMEANGGISPGEAESIQMENEPEIPDTLVEGNLNVKGTVTASACTFSRQICFMARGC